MADYNVMQSIMTNLSHRDMDGLTDALYPSEQISPQMTIVIKTLRQNLEYVLNASQFKYSNGAMEGINRMIKQIQRTAFVILIIWSTVFIIVKWHKKRTRLHNLILTYQQDLTKSQ